MTTATQVSRAAGLIDLRRHFRRRYAIAHDLFWSNDGDPANEAAYLFVPCAGDAQVYAYGDGLLAGRAFNAKQRAALRDLAKTLFHAAVVHDGKCETILTFRLQEATAVLEALGAREKPKRVLTEAQRVAFAEARERGLAKLAARRRERMAAVGQGAENPV